MLQVYLQHFEDCLRGKILHKFHKNLHVGLFHDVLVISKLTG